MFGVPGGNFAERRDLAVSKRTALAAGDPREQADKTGKGTGKTQGHVDKPSARLCRPREPADKP